VCVELDAVFQQVHDAVNAAQCQLALLDDVSILSHNFKLTGDCYCKSVYLVNVDSCTME